MSFYSVTALTAFVGALASLLIGFVWYGPFFGKKWAEVSGMKMPEGISDAEKSAMHKKMLPAYFLQFIMGFVMYYALGFFAAFIGRLSVSGALLYGLFIWIGFIMPLEAGNAIWSGKSKKLSWQMFLIMAGYQLVSILVAGLLWAVIYPHFM